MDIKYADKIPDLGHGGKSIKKELLEYGKTRGTVVEIAPYMGSATAYLCLASKSSKIHVFDIFSVDAMRAKAKKYNKIEFVHGESLINEFIHNTEPWAERITIHRCDIMESEWDRKKKISLYVDDYGMNKNQIERKMAVFSPAFKQGTILILMDYYFYESHGEKFAHQKQYYESHPEYKFIKRAGEKAAVYEYQKI